MSEQSSLVVRLIKIATTLLFIGALLSGCFWLYSHRDPLLHPSKYRVYKFRGTVTSDACVGTTASSDAGCAIYIDHYNSVLITEPDGPQAAAQMWGKTIGFTVGQNINGKLVEVAAHQVSPGNYDLSGKDLYVKLLN